MSRCSYDDALVRRTPRIQGRPPAEDPPHTRFLSDDTGRVVVELYTNPLAAITAFPAQHPLMFHLGPGGGGCAGRMSPAGASRGQVFLRRTAGRWLDVDHDARSVGHADCSFASAPNVLAAGDRSEIDDRGGFHPAAPRIHCFGIGDARRLQASVTDQIVGHSLTPMAASIFLQPDHLFNLPVV